MPKPKNYTQAELISRAMEQFWEHGFYATSIDDLVARTGVSRHGLYTGFKDKRGLFVSAVEAYFETVVTPAFARVEAEGAGLAEIRSYFEHQIRLAEQHGLPGPGCLVANTMTESGPHDGAFRALVIRHLGRLTAGFRSAIEHDARKAGCLPEIDAPALARMLTISAQGLWSVSRVIADAAELRGYVDTLLAPIEEKLGR